MRLGGGRRTRQIYSHGGRHQDRLRHSRSLVAIGVLCWLLLTLAVFALPASVGISAGIWAHQTAAGLLGPILIGAVGARVALGVGQLLLAVLRPAWLKLLVALAFVAPAAIAGFHATHGIVKHTMLSETWQLVFSVIGAIAIAVTTFIRVRSLTPPGSTGRGVANA